MPTPNLTSERNYTGAIALMVSLFFVFGIITVFNDVLIPHLKRVFSLSYTEATLIQFCFFTAYFVMALPSSKIVARYGYRHSVLIGLGVVIAGCLVFVPASATVLYPIFLLALFIMASGITLLQVAANPYLSALGHPDKAASRINLAGGFNSFATTIGPLIGAQLILSEAGRAKGAEVVQLPYVVLACFVLVLLMIFYKTKLPQLPIESKSESSSFLKVLEHRHLRLGVIAIFLYVGAEVTVGSFLINFLGLKSVAGLDEVSAAKYVSFYWGGAMVGRFLGFGFLHRLKTSKALLAVSVAAALAVVVGVFGSGMLSVWALVSIGLFNAIMWPCIFPLAIKNLGEQTSQGSGLLVMGVVGGAIVPLLQGFIADNFNLQLSFIVALFCYLYLVFYGVSGYQIKD